MKKLPEASSQTRQSRNSHDWTDFGINACNKIFIFSNRVENVTYYVIKYNTYFFCSFNVQLILYVLWGCRDNLCLYIRRYIKILHYMKHNGIKVKSRYKFSLWMQKDEWLILKRETKALNLSLREEDSSRQKPNGAHGYPGRGDSLYRNTEAKKKKKSL